MIKALLEDNSSEVKEFLEFPSDTRPTEIDGYILTCIEQYGGEDCGLTYFVVFSIEKDMQKEIYRCDGYYYSYDGVTIDPWDSYEVEPQEKTIIEWARK